jgi:hypothetical protein
MDEPPHLNDSPDGVEVPHDEHEAGRNRLEHLQHPVVKIPDGDAQSLLLRLGERGKGAPLKFLRSLPQISE